MHPWLTLLPGRYPPPLTTPRAALECGREAQGEFLEVVLKTVTSGWERLGARFRFRPRSVIGLDTLGDCRGSQRDALQGVGRRRGFEGCCEKRLLAVGHTVRFLPNQREGR